MKLPYLIPAIAVLLAACNDDAGIVASPAGVEGTYQLVEINGQPLPFDERGCCIFTAGSLELELSRYEISVTLQNRNNGLVGTPREDALDGTSIEFQRTSGDVAFPFFLFDGSVLGNGITLAMFGDEPGAADQFRAAFRK